jgi:hypothetical protein
MSASPALRPALLAALGPKYDSGGGRFLVGSRDFDADRLFRLLAADPAVVEAFATALHDSLDGNDPHFGEVGCRWLARALVTALFGDTGWRRP